MKNKLTHFAIHVNNMIEEVKSNGGKILSLKTALPYIGWIARFLDTEGNLIFGMQYDDSAR